MQNLERLEEALTSKKWKFEFTEAAECPQDLFNFFLTFLAHLKADSFEERLKLGGFYINGISAEYNAALKVPCKVEYYEPKFDITEVRTIYPQFKKEWIIYEDQYLLMIFKPRHLPSLPTKEQKLFNLKKYIENYLGHAVHMPSRLDTSTQGIVVCSKDPMMHNYLQQAFEDKIITKRYLLASHINPQWDFKAVKNLIAKDDTHPILRKVSESNGKKSLTVFSKIAYKQDQAYFIARPLTGRTHQIRLHAAHIGIPITGDNFYGGLPAPCLHLISYYAGLWHPYIREFISFTVPENLLPAWAAELDLSKLSA